MSDEITNLLDLLDMEDAPAQEPETVPDVPFDAVKHIASILSREYSPGAIQVYGTDQMPQRFLASMLDLQDEKLLDQRGIQEMSLERLCARLTLSPPGGAFKTGAERIARELHQRYSAGWVANIRMPDADLTRQATGRQEPPEERLREYQDIVGRHLPSQFEHLLAARTLLPLLKGSEARLPKAKGADDLKDLIMVSTFTDAFGLVPTGDMKDEEVALAAIFKGAGIERINGDDPIVARRKYETAIGLRKIAYEELRALRGRETQRIDYRAMKHEIIEEIRGQLGIVVKPYRVFYDYEYEDWKQGLYKEVQTGYEMLTDREAGTRRLDNLTREERVATIKPSEGTRYSDGTHVEDLPVGTIGTYDGERFRMDRRGHEFRLESKELVVLRARKRNPQDEATRQTTLENIIRKVETNDEYKKQVLAARQRMLDLGVAETTINYLIERNFRNLDDLKDAGLLGDTWATRLNDMDGKRLGRKQYEKLVQKVQAEFGIVLPAQEIRDDAEFRRYAKALFDHFLDGYQPKPGARVKEGMWAFTKPEGDKYKYGHTTRQLPAGILVQVGDECDRAHHINFDGEQLHIYPHELVVAERAFPDFQTTVRTGAQVTVRLKRPDWRETYLQDRKRNFPTGTKGKVVAPYTEWDGRQKGWWVHFPDAKITDLHEGWDFDGKRMRDGYAIFEDGELLAQGAGDAADKLEQLRQQYEPALQRILQEVETELQGTGEQRLAIARQTCEDLRSLGYTRDQVRQTFADTVRDWRAYENLF